jgi:hypothetical protein
MKILGVSMLLVLLFQLANAGICSKHSCSYPYFVGAFIFALSAGLLVMNNAVFRYVRCCCTIGWRINQLTYGSTVYIGLHGLTTGRCSVPNFTERCANTQIIIKQWKILQTRIRFNLAVICAWLMYKKAYRFKFSIKGD